MANNQRKVYVGTKHNMHGKPWRRIRSGHFAEVTYKLLVERYPDYKPEQPFFYKDNWFKIGYNKKENAYFLYKKINGINPEWKEEKWKKLNQ